MTKFSSIPSNQITLGLGTHLFVKVPRPGDSEGNGTGNLVKCFAQGHNKRTCQLMSILSLLNAKRQAVKLCISTFKVF